MWQSWWERTWSCVGMLAVCPTCALQLQQVLVLLGSFPTTIPVDARVTASAACVHPTPQCSSLQTHLSRQPLQVVCRLPPPQIITWRFLTTSVRSPDPDQHTLTDCCPSGAGSSADSVPGAQPPAPTGVAARSAVPPPAWAVCHATAVPGAAHDVPGVHVGPAH